MKSYLFSSFLISCLTFSSSLAVDTKVHIVAGTGQSGYWGDGGSALEARLNNPFGVIVAPDGDIIFCDTMNHVIRRISRKSGQIDTIVGSGERGYAGDGGHPLETALNEPYEVRFHPNGDLYWVERNSHTVRRLSARTNTVHTVAGTGEQGFSGDGGPAVEAQLNQPHSIVFDRAGTYLLICDIKNYRIRKVDLKSGQISTWCGTGEREPTEDGAALGPQTPLKGPRALSQGPGTSFFLALREGNQVFHIDTETKRLSLIAGTGEKGFHAEARPALESLLSGPKGVALSPDFSRVYLADTESHTVRMIDFRESPAVVSLLVGTGSKGDGEDGVEALDCGMARLHGVGVDPITGDLYIGDSETHRLRRIAQDYEGREENVKQLTDYEIATFEVGGRSCRVALPGTPVEGKPWIWRCRFWGAFSSVDARLLREGWHVAYIDVANEFGGPRAMEAFEAFYPVVRERFGLSQKAVMEGFSRGGLPATLWSIRHPNKVAGIYLDAPVLDIRSWPRNGSEKAWLRCLEAWDLSEEAVDEWMGPLDQVKPLIDAEIPVMVVAGGDDEVVPFSENSGIFEQRFVEEGGDFTAIVKAAAGHHPHSLHDPSPVVEWAWRVVGKK